jgi:hypothetical protein
MDEIAQRREERCRELTEDLLPIFGNCEDAGLAAIMLVLAVGFGFGTPIGEDDWSRYLAELEALPKSSTAEARVRFVSPYGEGAGRHWRVTFTDGYAEYPSSRRFLTEAEASAWASDFLRRWSELGLS